MNEKEEAIKAEVIESYIVDADGIKVEVFITKPRELFTKKYLLNYPEIGIGTRTLMHNIRDNLIASGSLPVEKIQGSAAIEEMKESFKQEILRVIDQMKLTLDDEIKKLLASTLMHEMLGLGIIEVMLADTNLEEIVINSAQEPVWVYHKKFGWLQSNIKIQTEGEIENYANIIARKIGKQISTLNPLLDAHLLTGDRANATLFPISGRGNTITIRRFRRDPWTIIDLIKNNTMNTEIGAFIWEAIQYEMSIIFSGGTASGKTTLLGSCLPFIQPYHRMISIEDTRELKAPDFLHWVPLTTRQPNPEGKGEITMLDLLVNSLRMRPDRIIVGEIRRQREAEVMFEAMHTGHSVYTTLHANTAEETIRRLISPPINVPTAMLEAVDLNIVMFRNRRLGTRRILQIAEYIPEKRGQEETVKANILYRWKAADDIISKHAESIKFYDELGLHTGLTVNEINEELKEKKAILSWMQNKNYRSIQEVGRIMAEYYFEPNYILDLVNKKKEFDFSVSTNEKQ